MKFIIISDTHIGGRFTEVPLIRGIELINQMKDIDYAEFGQNMSKLISEFVIS